MLRSVRSLAGAGSSYQKRPDSLTSKRLNASGSCIRKSTQTINTNHGKNLKGLALVPPFRQVITHFIRKQNIFTLVPDNVSEFYRPISKSVFRSLFIDEKAKNSIYVFDS